MLSAARSGSTAQTLAQLLVRIDRYDPDTGRYHRSDHDRANAARTVIVDESSMLTEEALDALLDGIEGFDRLIFVGDPRQLPPIGVGRPFVDIVQHLREQCGNLAFPRVGPSYAELTVPRRQVGNVLAAIEPTFCWRNGSPAGSRVPAPTKCGSGSAAARPCGTISVRQWMTSGDLEGCFAARSPAALPQMSGADDADGFQAVVRRQTRRGPHLLQPRGRGDRRGLAGTVASPGFRRAE